MGGAMSTLVPPFILISLLLPEKSRHGKMAWMINVILLDNKIM